MESGREERAEAVMEEITAGGYTCLLLADCAISLWYFLAHTAVFARLWASLFRTYLAPGLPDAVLCAVPLAAGLALCGRGLRFRARASRYTGIACLTGCACAAAAGAVCVAACVLLTSRERWLAGFPEVEAMRRLRPFGIETGRYEIVPVILLLAGLTVMAAGGIWYVRKSWEYLYAAGLPYAEKIRCHGGRISGTLTGHRLWWWAVLLTVYVLAAGFADAFSALTFYRAYNIQILVPAMAGFYLATKVAVSRKKML